MDLIKCCWTVNLSLVQLVVDWHVIKQSDTRQTTESNLFSNCEIWLQCRRHRTHHTDRREQDLMCFVYSPDVSSMTETLIKNQSRYVCRVYCNAMCIWRHRVQIWPENSVQLFSKLCLSGWKSTSLSLCVNELFGQRPASFCTNIFVWLHTKKACWSLENCLLHEFPVLLFVLKSFQSQDITPNYNIFGLLVG